MDTRERTPRDHGNVIERFVEACSADDRVVAAFLHGSYARGEADQYSDLDLALVTTDDARAQVWGGRASLIRRLGEPIFLEDFASEVTCFFILADGTEGELSIGREGRLQEIHEGPFQAPSTRLGSSGTRRFRHTIPIRQSRRRRCDASCSGSGTSSPISPQRLDAVSSGGPMVSSRRCAACA